MADGFSRGRSLGSGGLFGGSYGLTIIGAAVYFIGHAGTFWAGLLGLLKALVWPAFVIYKVLELLKL
ncbi:MAG TPA: hypothetical protein VMW73_11935 [Spirochaetia bacterium]|nr:hypothetical protein [Spirochaetia bacterium]